MKPIQEFLSQLAALDIKLWLEENRLRCYVPQGISTSEIQINQLRERKAEIIKFLQYSQQPLIPQNPPSDEPLALSWAQERLWFINQLEGKSATYNIPGAFRINGNLDINALQQALTEIVKRHKVLHTSFQTENGTPIQVIEPDATMKINLVDLQQLETTQQENVVLAQVQLEAITPFDLENAPLIRCSLLQLSTSEYVLLLTMHHIVSDGWSIGVFIQETSSLYQAFTQGKPSPLADLPIQYADFAVWQRQYLSGEVLENQLNYWKQQLSGAPDLLQVPTDYPRPTVISYQGRNINFSLNTDLTTKLQSLSQESGTTLFMTLYAAFSTLLYRYSSQSDILIGTPIANRNHSEIEGLIGFFVNTLVLRTSFEENPSFKELLAQVRETTLKAYEHQDVPFEQVVEALQPQRSLSYSPLFQVMFVLQNAPMGDVKLPDVTLSPIEFESTIAQFDLTLSMTETEQGLRGEWEYNTDLFKGETIERMIVHFRNLLEAIAENPSQKVGEITLLSESERHQLLFEWNNTATEYPSDKCIHQLFEEQVEKTPDTIAIVFEDEQLTYQQLNQKANQLAHHLQNLGVKPEVLVGICAERSMEIIVGLLGILKAGGAYVPLDPNYPPERLNYMLADSGVEVLVTQSSLLESLPDNQALLVCMDSDEIEQYSQENFDTGVDKDNLAYVIYTSGSTGQPKGVQICHQNLVNLSHGISHEYALTSEDRFLQFASISFDVAAEEIFPTLLTGATLILKPVELSLEFEDFSRFVAQENLSVLNLPAAYWNAWVLDLSEDKGNISKDLRLVIVGSDQVFAKTMVAWHKLVGNRVELRNAYGVTETAITSTVYNSSNRLEQPKSKLAPIGKPIANTQVYILDHHLQPLPIGIPGELYLGGAGVARGYLNRPELTKDKFITNPFNNDPSERLYKTGDLARYLNDGNIEFLGRIDNQVKIRGFRIELGEIEAVLATHSQVQQVVVIATEENTGSRSLVAYIVANEEITTQQLIGYVKEKLPGYMVPSAFIILDILPLTPNGKIDRKALPAPDILEQDTEYIAPRTDTEKTLTEIWSQLLPVKRVSIHDNFFEIGGDSILSIQVISRAKNAGIQITAKQIFQHQTIAELAVVANTTVSSSSDCKQGIVTGVAPLTPIQHLFFEEQTEELHHFNQSVLLKIPHNIEPQLLEKALEKLTEHHDALRLSFNLIESEYQQTNQGLENKLPLTVIDLSEHSTQEQPQEIERIATEYQGSLNLATGQIIQVVMFNLGEKIEGRLLIIIHHLAVDGVSWRILLEDLENIYQQLIKRKSVTLAPKTTAFIDWATKLKSYGQSEIIKQELDYWVNQSWSNTTSLPLDLLDYIENKQQNTVSSTVDISVKLDSKSTSILLGSVNEAYNTQINDILLSALSISLAEWTGKNKVLIDLEGHGREEIFDDVDLSSTVGWFTSLFPVLLQLPDDIQIESVIKSIKEQLRAIPNRGIGFGILRYLSAPEINERIKQIPTGEICFNYLGQFDQIESETGWKFASESTGIHHSLRQNRSHYLDVNALVVEGELQITWTYSSNIHSHNTVEKLAHNYLKAIKSIIEHCQLEQNKGYTPSDFPLAQLNQLEIDELLSKQENKNIDSIYPLSPSQQGMLFETLFSSNQGIHIEQSIFKLQAELDLLAFEKTWQCIVERYSLLRTAFIWEDRNEPLQVVFKEVEVKLEQQDWREFSPYQQQEKLQVYLKKDELRGFQVTAAPLIRLTLIRTSNNIYQFIFTSHHILMDGWSVPLILKEVFAFYEAFSTGKDLSLQPNRPYRDYIAWLKQQNLSQAEEFWHKQLQGFTTPTPLGNITQPDSLSKLEVGYGKQKVSLCESTTVALQSKVRQHGLTLNTLVQGVWALLLSRYSGREDVIFGATVSGRPPDLVGVESMVGLFINTIPIRLQVSPEASFWSWLQDIQEQSLQKRDYEYCSQGQIHQWSDIPSSLPLYESIVVFENYPVDSSVLQSQNHHTNLLEVDSIGAQTKYALTIMVVPGSQLEFFIIYDRYRFDNPDIIQILEHFQILLKSVVDFSEQHLATLIGQIQPEQIPQVRPIHRQVQNQLQQDFDTPRNLREFQLVQIWKDILGVDNIGIHDNFFELGGHSLLAVRLMSEIQKQFGKNLPLATLFQSSTIEKLALALDANISSQLWETLVPIQANGSLPPLFCVPGAGGNVVYFHHLARYLGSNQPLYGLQAQGLDGETEPYKSVEKIATEHIKAIQTVQATGPYFLAGHSFGGHVVFEMAVQLQSMGESVAYVGILDIPALIKSVNHQHDFSNWDDANWLYSMAGVVRELGSKNLVLDYQTLTSLNPEQQLNYFKEQLEMVGFLPPQTDIKFVRGLVQIYQVQCQIKYEPQNTDSAPITLFCAREVDMDSISSQEPAWGWNHFSDGEVEVHIVPGNHISMIGEPHVKILADKLQKSLEKVRKPNVEKLNV